MIRPCHYKKECGNKPYELGLMLSLYLLQNLYTLSDEATMAEVIDSRTFSDFFRVECSNQVPDGGYAETISQYIADQWIAGKAVHIECGDAWKSRIHVFQRRLDAKPLTGKIFHSVLKLK